MQINILDKNIPIFTSVHAEGIILRKTAKIIVLKNARGKGELIKDDWIPCLLSPPSANTFFMTSGQPKTEYFTAVYCPERDIAIQLQADKVVINGLFVEFEGEKCTLEMIPDYYKNLFNPFFKRFNKNQFPNPPVGWLSWYCFFCDFNEEKTEKIANFAEKYFKSYGFEYVLLETWQKNSDELPCKNYYNNIDPDMDKFPRGLRYITDMLHEKGLKAGLWLVPLGTGEKEFFKKNPEWHLRNDVGKPLENWSGKYLLDPTYPAVKKYIANIIKTIVNDWGFDYIKIDGLEMGQDYSNEFFDKPFNQKLLYNKEKEPLRNVIKLMRESMGEKIFFLACGADTDNKSKCPGLVDGARIGQDVFYDDENTTWNSIIHTAKVTTNAYHLHNIAWYNDPDVLSIREPLSLEHAQTLCTIVGLTGQVLFLGDILYELSPDRVAMLRKLMPVCDIYPAHLACNKELQSIWNLIIKRNFEQWNVVGLFNWNKQKSKRMEFSMRDIGLEPDKEYLIYDFWQDKFICSTRDRASIKLKKQSSLLIAIREKRDYPQILSIDRHITQGGICIKSVEWDSKSLSLNTEMDLPEEDTFTVTLYVTEPFQLKTINGGVFLKSEKDDIIKLKVRNGRWSCCFDKK